MARADPLTTLENDALAAKLRELADLLEQQGLHFDALRVRGFPFSDEVSEFVSDHDQVFVVEQNRDAQLRMLLVNECVIDPAKLIPILHYDGTPITARFTVEEIAQQMKALNVTPLRRVAP